MSASAESPEPIYLLGNGRYAVYEPIGEGGAATVHRCVDRELGARRAIKLTRATDDAALRVRRLSDEARVMASLADHAVVPIYDVGLDQGWQYVVMELATGGSVAGRLAAGGPLGPGPAVDLMLPVLDALEAAHQAGIIHRDLKPHNILLDSVGRPLLADFGIARVDDRDTMLTRTGSTMGSLAYMAPEQRIDAHDVTATADVYGAGATLFNLLTCASPVDLFTLKESSYRWQGVPPDLQPLIAVACAFRPEDRFPSAGAFAAALRGVRPTLSDAPSQPAQPARGSTGQTPTRTVSDTLAPGGASPGVGTPRRLASRATTVAIALLGTVIVAGSSWLILRPDPLVQPVLPDPVAEIRREPIMDVPEPTAPLAVADVETPTPVPVPVRHAPAADPVVTPRADAPPPPVDMIPTDPMGPSLPIHGPWRGSFEGRAIELRLEGPAGRLAGVVGVASGERPPVARARGAFDASTGVLSLHVDDVEPLGGDWRCDLDGDRLKGTVTRSSGGEVVAVSLRRASGQ